MSLVLDSWTNSRKEMNQKTIHQLLNMCGDGKLKDGNLTSVEYREFLSAIPNENITRYTSECISSDSDKSNRGLVLQDLINEIGGRLGFNVTHGRYRGTSNIDTIGFDGLWKTPSNDSIVIEIKTSSTYNIDLGVVGTYKRQLIENGKCSEEKTSILLVVGGFNTDGWESQIRGSKRLWDTRIISVDGLLRLLDIKGDIDEPEVFNKISNILIPKEYTKVDGIIDIVFSTTEDLKSDIQETVDEEVQKGNGKKKSPQFTPVAFHEKCIERVQSHLNTGLIKNTRSTYIDSKKETAVTCVVSKEYPGTDNSTGYWFAFHPHQKERLLDFPRGYLGLGCGSPELIILFPIQSFIPHLDKMNTTIRSDRCYHHIHIKNEGDDIYLLTKRDFDHVKVNEFKI
jgi:hypothetical protein